MNKLFSLLLFLLVGANCHFTLSQNTISDTLVKIQKPDYTFRTIGKGIEYCETDAPLKSVVNDSKITIVRIDPSLFDFEMKLFTENGQKRTVKEWADTFDFDIVINAGMYELSDGKTSRGYLKNYQHHNNGTLRENYNSMIAFNPVDSMETPFKVLDLECENWHEVKDDYNSFAQGLRMIDCNQGLIGWNKRKQSCSMLVTAMDPMHRVYFIFSRSPYTHNEMIQFMSAMPFELYNAIYMEGGPETSLYVKTDDITIEKMGSYVSDTYEKDTNNTFWKLPNVIGIRLKN
jgi:hypothetical protein